MMVAEISANHGGTLARAMQIVQAAAAAGADAVKFQTWTPGTMVRDTDHVLQDGPWKGRRLADLYEEAYTPMEWLGDLFAAARAAGVKAFSTPFDAGALAALERLGCPMYKIASFELVDLPLIRAVARTGKPMILSTGMATDVEISDAVEAARGCGARNITLLQCTSAYPANAAEANLSTMLHMRATWECPVGLSDHTPGTAVAAVAAALGATVIEKHLTLRRADGGPDAAFSLEPDEFARLVTDCRQAAVAMGRVAYGPSAGEAAQVPLRRSVHLARDVEPGHILTAEDLTTARPATGVSPRFFGRLIGRTMRTAQRAGAPLQWFMLAERQPEVTA